MTHLESLERDAVALAARQELARRHIVDYAKLNDRNYVDARHIKYLCGVLESLERGPTSANTSVQPAARKAST